MTERMTKLLDDLLEKTEISKGDRKSQAYRVPYYIHFKDLLKARDLIDRYAQDINKENNQTINKDVRKNHNTSNHPEY